MIGYRSGLGGTNVEHVLASTSSLTHLVMFFWGGGGLWQVYEWCDGTPPPCICYAKVPN